MNIELDGQEFWTLAMWGTHYLKTSPITNGTPKDRALLVKIVTTYEKQVRE